MLAQIPQHRYFDHTK